MTCRGCLIAAALVAALAPRAFAADGAKQRAAKLLDVGVAQFEDGHPTEAYASFQAAYQLYPSAKILLNMGQALKALGRNAEAARAYESFLVEMSAQPDVGDRRVTLARAGLAEVLPRIGRLRLDVQPAEALVSLDGVALGRASQLRTIYLEPGDHRVVASAAGFVEKAALVSAAAAGEQRVELGLEAIPAPVAPVVEAPVAPPRRRWIWAAAGASAAFLAGGIGFGVHARSMWHEYQTTDSPQRYDQLKRSIGREQVAANALFVAAGAAAIGAGVLYYYEGTHRREMQVGLLASEQGFWATAGWAF